MPASDAAFRLDSQWQRALLVSLHLMGWALYGVVYYLTLRPHQPFGDILWKQTLIATGTGLVFSTLLGGAYWALELHRKHPVWQTLLVIVAATGTGLAWYQVKTWGAEWVNPFIAPVFGRTFWRPGEGSLLSSAPVFPVILLVWSGLYLSVVHWYGQQRQERRRLRADAEAQRARLRMLRYQLNPHFFFNALNTIGALADEAPGRVKEAVRELSGFLRYTLLDNEDLEVSLRDELRAAEHYLAVEKIRFEDDLQVEVDVNGKAERQTVPAFLVLPLVENAVKHGQRTSPSPLHICVTGTWADGTLVIEVANTGHWREPPAEEASTDTGLDNVRRRLEARYPEHHRFAISEDDGWVRARIDIDTDALDRHD